MKRISLLLILLAIPVLALAQHPSDYNAGGAFPQINADNSVTVQVRAPQAKAITLDLGKRYPMKNDGNGVWTATTEPMVPGFHYYSLNVGGLATADPATYTFFGMIYSGINSTLLALISNGGRFRHIPTGKEYNSTRTSPTSCITPLSVSM